MTKSQRERGTVGQEVRGQRVQRPGQWSCGYGVRWVCGPRAECQGERHLGGLYSGSDGREGHGAEGGDPEGEGGDTHWRISSSQLSIRVTHPCDVSKMFPEISNLSQETSDFGWNSFMVSKKSFRRVLTGDFSLFEVRSYEALINSRRITADHSR